MGKKVVESKTQKEKRAKTLPLSTKKFVNLIKKKRVVDLNEASVWLRVKKRRLYDVTNVLQGIGMVKKPHKNTVIWCAEQPNQRLLSEVCETNMKVQQLRREESVLEGWIAHLLRSRDGEGTNGENLLFCTPKDIERASDSSPQGMFATSPSHQKDCVIAVHSPSGSVLDVAFPRPSKTSPLPFKMNIRTSDIGNSTVSALWQLQDSAVSERDLGKPIDFCLVTSTHDNPMNSKTFLDEWCQRMTKCQR